ncbi:CHRD domain-containing protein [Wenzhouxiangella sp. XN201]|uniref:CHRD domain-containing protein n=1 Tax=Wenzhouxiangella sp. XN201 TaxID=2710755 RepID=UPI0013C727B8|nr:CHRD domain-containing protein [Wenzhouxiangella sp. XN201]NEZ05096.1 CHRD domain-containing protein [Wenzhouxiangella sp. XN201]
MGCFNRKHAVLSPLVAVVLAVPTLASAERIQASLSGYEEVPSVSTVAIGDFRAMISPDGGSIDFELSYFDLQGDVTMAHIHFANADVNGSVVAWLCGTAAIPGPAGTATCPESGTVSGTITASEVVGSSATQQIMAGDLDAVIAAIRAGAAYVNVHSVLSPGGEIRGQIRGSRRK